MPPVSPVPPKLSASPRVRFARLALETALSVPGVFAGDAGPARLRVTADAPAGTLRGVSVTAQADGRYAIDLCLVVEASGPIALVAALSGLGAVLLGLLLMAGVLVSRRERLVTLAEGQRGSLAARRRPLAQAATALVEQVRGVTEARVRMRPRRTGGGRLAVRASQSRRVEARHWCLPSPWLGTGL